MNRQWLSKCNLSFAEILQYLGHIVVFFFISDFCPKLEEQEIPQERQFWRFPAYFGALEIQIVWVNLWTFGCLSELNLNSKSSRVHSAKSEGGRPIMIILNDYFLIQPWIWPFSASWEFPCAAWNNEKAK